MKTKPTQHSVKELRSIGIQPDIWFAGAIAPSSGLKQKMSNSAMPVECVTSRMPCIYGAESEREGLAQQALDLLQQINANRI